MGGGVGVRPRRNPQCAGRSRAPPASAARRSRRGSALPSSRRAMTNTCRQQLRGVLPLVDRAMAAPAARNRPSSSHSCASTSTAARKPTTGSSRPTSSAASAQRNHARRDQDGRCGYRGDRLRPAARLDHREHEHHGQRGKRERQLHGSARCHSVGRCSGMPSSSASARQHPHRDIEVVAGVGQRPQRLGAAAGRSRPSGSARRGVRRRSARSRSSSRRDSAPAARPAARRRGRPRRRADRPSAPGTKPALPTISSRRSDRPVVHQRRPRLAALVGRRLHRWDDRRGDDAGKAVRRTVFATPPT